MAKEPRHVAGDPGEMRLCKYWGRRGIASCFSVYIVNVFPGRGSCSMRQTSSSHVHVERHERQRSYLCCQRLLQTRIHFNRTQYESGNMNYQPIFFSNFLNSRLTPFSTFSAFCSNLPGACPGWLSECLRCLCL